MPGSFPQGVYSLVGETDVFQIVQKAINTMKEDGPCRYGELYLFLDSGSRGTDLRFKGMISLAFKGRVSWGRSRDGAFQAEEVHVQERVWHLQGEAKRSEKLALKKQRGAWHRRRVEN